MSNFAVVIAGHLAPVPLLPLGLSGRRIDRLRFLVSLFLLIVVLTFPSILWYRLVIFLVAARHLYYFIEGKLDMSSDSVKIFL